MRKIKLYEKIKVIGHVKVYLFPADLVPDKETFKKLTDEEKSKYLVADDHNTITLFGLNLIPIILSGGTNTLLFCAVGTGTPTATALGAEIAARVGVTWDYAINNEYHIDTFYGKFEPDSVSHVLTETGLFNQLAAGGEMYASKTISFTKDTTVTMAVQWTWSFA